MPDHIRITYVRSAIGRSYRQKRVIKALGLRRLHYSRVLPDTPAIRGMINKVIHLLKLEKVDTSEVTTGPKKTAKVKRTKSEPEVVTAKTEKVKTAKVKRTKSEPEVVTAKTEKVKTAKVKRTKSEPEVDTPETGEKEKGTEVENSKDA